MEVSRTRKYQLSGYFLCVIKHTGLAELNGGARGSHEPSVLGEKEAKSIVIILGSGATLAFMLWVQLWCNFKVAPCAAVSNRGLGLLLPKQP